MPGVIRDPIHNQEQGLYGVIWIPDNNNPKKGELAVYKKNDELKHLPAGYQLDGKLVKFDNGSKKPFIWCGCKIRSELTKITIIGPETDLTAYVEKCLQGHGHFNTQLKNPVSEEDGDRIYPLTE
jgi:hypothetical protein